MVVRDHPSMETVMRKREASLFTLGWGRVTQSIAVGLCRDYDMYMTVFCIHVYLYIYMYMYNTCIYMYTVHV